MAKGKLFGRKDNFRVQKALVAAKLVGADVQLAGDAAPADKFPLHVTPAFDGDVALFGESAILLHLAGDVKKHAEIAQWLQWSEGTLLPNVLGYVLPSISAASIGDKILQAYKTELFAVLKSFNDILLSHTFLVGERLSVADVSVAFDLRAAFENVLDDAARKQFGNVTRWFLTVFNQPAVKEVAGDVQLAKSIAKFDQAKFDKLASTSKSAKEEKPKKAEAPKKEAPKKKEAEEDDDDAGVPKEPAKDPFAEIAKTNFNFDAFKRVYSNEDTATKAIPFFWENFDHENTSIWKGVYKYPEDLGKIFMSCNLISGMFQRLDKLNKNAFGSVVLSGTEGDLQITGIWVFRGQKLGFELSPDWMIDYESYEWKKLDSKDENVKKEVNEYLLWEGTFAGKPFAQGKIFK